MIILGIDPGIERTGYAFLEAGKIVKVLSCGCITTDKKQPIQSRLMELANDLDGLIKKYKPQRTVVESLFFAANTKTAMTVGHARGAILLTLAKNRITILELTPLQVKMSVTGYGRAEKKQVHGMIQKILKLKKIPKPDDVADAVAIAWAGLGR
jgi:crossover junction endodeoxyribonuclease RuvC